jgi:putative DNA primase/helicase
VSPLETFLDRLEGVKRNGSGYQALCPCHDDHKPSLSIDEHGDTLLMVCRACGANGKQVALALGLEPSALYADSGRQGDRPEVSRYQYTDEGGRRLFDVVRYPGKQFMLARPGEQPQRGAMQGVRRALYRLPEVVAAVADGRWVVVVEGEKDADRLASLGIAATTNPMGAGKWHLGDYSPSLTGGKVAVVPDNDDPGRRHASQVVASVGAVAERVVLVDLAALWAEAPDKADVSDWLDGPGDLDTLTAAIEAAEPDDDAVVAAVAGRRYVVKGEGLQAAQLREAVHDQLILARGPGRLLYRYHSGVWRPDGDDAVHAVVADLMRDDYRPGHARNVIEATAALAPRRIDDEPVPGVINFRNGLLVLESMELVPHDPDVPSVNQVPHDWNPDAEAPRAEQFMAEVFPADAIELGWELLGYGLYDGNPLQKAALLQGDGENGKGEFLRLCQSVYGRDNYAAVPLQTLGENRFAAAELFGKLANIAGDLPSAYVSNTATFKKLTGEDSIHAERKFRDPFTFTARAFPIFSANEVPGSEDASHGYLRRWVVVPFPNRFPPEAREPGLTDRLASEAEGVLVRAVGALGNVLTRGGFSEPRSTQEAFEDFARYLDPVRSFLTEELTPSPDAMLDRILLYQVYRRWAQDEGIGVLSAKKFTPRLRAAAKALGWQLGQTKVRGERKWEHVALRDRPKMGGNAPF